MPTRKCLGTNKTTFQSILGVSISVRKYRQKIRNGGTSPPLLWTMSPRGTSALHLNEATWIIDGSNELIVDFLFALVLFLDSTQPWPFKNPKQIFFFGSNKRMTCKSNSNAKPNPGQHHSSFHLLLHSNAGLVFLLTK